MNISRIFSWYHIPTNIGIPKSIYGTSLVQKILSYDNLEVALEEIEKEIHTEEEHELLEKMISILNHYQELPNDSITRSMIVEEIKNTVIPVSSLEIAVEEGNIDTVYDDSYHIFVIGFNQGVLPLIHKDEDFLSDEELSILGRSTSNDKNLLERKRVLSFLSTTKNN